MATTQKQLDEGLKLADVQANQAGLSRDEIAAKAQSLTVPAPTSGTITSDVLSGNTKPLTLPPPTVQTLASGTQDYIASQNQSIKTAQQQELDQMQKSLDSQKNDILGLITDIGNSGQIKNDLYRKEGVDAAKKQVDEFTSRLEAEQHSNTRRIQAIQKNPQGLFAGGMEQEINRVNSESLTKQADIAILQNNALRRYSTAAEIADRAVEAKLEPMKAKLEGLKFFYAENKADFDKKDERAYAEMIKKEERTYQTQKDNVTKAFSSGLRTQFINEGGKIFRASDGKEYSDPQSFFADAGVSSFDQAYQNGLIGDLTLERVADMDFVKQLRAANPMAGISITDTADQAVSKVNDYNLAHPSSDGGFTLGENEIRYDTNGNIVAKGSGVGANGQSPVSQYQIDANARIMASADDLIGRTDNSTVGIGGVVGRKIPGSAAANYSADMDTLKANIAFGALQQMRDASKTGGALGQVSERELALLESTLAGLNLQQSPENMKKNLQTIKDSIQRFNEAAGVANQSSTTTYTKDQIKQMYPQASEQEINDAFNSQGGNQVKGWSGKAQPLPYLDPNTFQPIPTKSGGVSVAPTVQRLSPAGSVGGQCGTWVRSIVNKLGATYPKLGDTLKSKISAVMKFGTSIANAHIGSVIVTRENPTYGHVAYIIGRNAKGWIVGESNYKQSGRVSYGRVIPFNSPKLIGIINPTRRGWQPYKIYKLNTDSQRLPPHLREWRR